MANRNLGEVNHSIIPATSDQAFILESGLMDSPFSCLLALETGSGKTRLAQESIRKALVAGMQQGRKVRIAYTAPIKALAQAQYEEWVQHFKSVGIFNSDHTTPPTSFKDAQVLILTPEKLDVCLRRPQAYPWLNDLMFIVVDELHTLADQERGARLEGVILRLQMVNPMVRVLGLSATLGNLPELAGWLEAIVYQSSHRPIPLKWQSVRYHNGKHKLSQLIKLVQERPCEQYLVFCQSKRRTEEIALALREEGITSDFHHAGRYPKERAIAEASFKQKRIVVLCATSSLAMGVNLPAKNVVIYDLQRSNGVSFQPLQKREVVQMAGRAGRIGYDTTGVVTLMAHKQEGDLIVGYSNAQIGCEPIHSQLSHIPYLTEQIIVAVNGNYANTVIQIERMMNRSLAALQGTLPDIPKAVEVMLEAGLLEENTRGDRSYLKTTFISQVAIRHLISPETVLCFRRVLGTPSITFLDLLITVCASPDFSPLIPVGLENLKTLQQILEGMPSSLMSHTQVNVELTLGCSANKLLRVIHTAAILRQWTVMGTVGTVAQEFQHQYPVEIERDIESAGRLLTALEDLVSVVKVAETNQVPTSERIEVLKQMVQSGLDESAATLMRVPGIAATRARALKDAGIQDIEDLATAEIGSLTQIPGIANKGAQDYIKNAAIIAKQVSPHRYREETDDKNSTEIGSNSEEIYEQTRAQELKCLEISDREYFITGGTDGHTVLLEEKAWICDCKIFAKGRGCRHVIRVEIEYGLEITRTQQAHAIDLQALWVQGRLA